MSITSQTKRFDPDCKYIKKWIPELKNIDKKYIINRDMYGEHYDSEYPDPIVDEKTTRLSMIKYMKKYI
jgi:deoxyribodipyrimidine photo-lyase